MVQTNLLGRAALVTGVAGIVLTTLALPARADTQADSIVYDATVAADGTLAVTETITLPRGATDQVTQRLATRAPAAHDSSYLYDISGVKVAAGGADLGAAVHQDGDYLVIDVDPGKAQGKAIAISYSVKGATHPAPTAAGRPARTTLNWRLLQGLSVGAKNVTGEVSVPGQVTGIDCQSGPPAALSDCTMSQFGTEDAMVPSFSDGPRGPGEVVQFEVVTSGSAVAATEHLDQQWSLDRAFRLSPLAIGLTLGTLLLGALALWLLHRSAGRDVTAQSRATRIAEFAPAGEGVSEFTLLEDVRPGQVGTVADEQVDPVDVTATLLDLAVRGHLRIHELPRTSVHAPIDWTFERLEGGRGELRPYERLLLDAVAPAGAEACKVSGIASAVADVVADVQSKLYDDVVERGWFDKRPDDARNSWTLFGWAALTLAVVAAGLLVGFTTLGLWGLALVAVALGLVFVAQEMPRRSAEGSALLAGLHLLASDLQHHRTDQMPRGREYAELSGLLPYAVVLGGKDRWLQAIVAADDDEDVADPTDLAWYHAPQTWHLRDLPVSIDAFITTVQGHLFGR